MSTSDPAAAMAAKEAELGATAARIGVLTERLANGASRRRELADMLGEGEDGRPLAMLPLTAALVGAVGANGAMFFGYVIYLTRFHVVGWNALLVVALLLAGGSLPLSSRAGAGGRARLGLRRFAVAGLVVALIETAAALARH
jgi:hypothetical protein